MDHTTNKVHVMPEGDQWNVEDQDGALLAHTFDKAEAIAHAKALALGKGLSAVVVHDGDGVTEEVAV